MREPTIMVCHVCCDMFSSPWRRPVKLFLSCVAALSLATVAACADDPSGGGSGANVSDTKGEQDPLVRQDSLVNALSKGMHFRTEDIRFSAEVGTWAESLLPDGFDHTCVNCELVAQHQSDGKIDDTSLWTMDGNYVCHVRQTAVYVLENTCNWQK